MRLTRWRPQRDLLGFQDELTRMFNRFFDTDLLAPFQDDGEGLTRSTWYPAVDIAEEDDAFIVTAELPGLKKKDIHVSYQDGMLTLEGERKRESKIKEENYHRVERSYGKFSRNFQLPSGVQADKIDAKFSDGILTITVPKAEEAKPKEIEVKVAAS